MAVRRSARSRAFVAGGWSTARSGRWCISRNLPSIVVTLGLSFVWLGIAVLVLPSPGGKAPDWLKAIMGLQFPIVPFPIIAALVIGVAVHLALMLSSFGVVARGAGGNPKALTRAGWSMMATKVACMGWPGFSACWRACRCSG